MTQTNDLLQRLEELNDIGIALSSERDINRLLETILVAAKRIAHADAGTLYLLDKDQGVLRFEIIRTDSLGIAMGGTTGKPISFNPVRLYDGRLHLLQLGECIGIDRLELCGHFLGQASELDQIQIDR